MRPSKNGDVSYFWPKNQQRKGSIYKSRIHPAPRCHRHNHTSHPHPTPTRSVPTFTPCRSLLGSGGGTTASLVLMMGTMFMRSSSCSVLFRFCLLSSSWKSRFVTRIWAQWREPLLLRLRPPEVQIEIRSWQFYVLQAPRKIENDPKCQLWDLTSKF